MHDASPEVFHIERERTRASVLLRSIAGSLPLVLLLARKEFHVRYRRASFGMAWAVALPLVQAGVLAVVLDQVTTFDTPLPLAVFIYAGTLPFVYLSTTVVSAATSIVDNSHLSSRVYFPRAVLPLMVVQSNVYGLACGLGSLLVLALAVGAGLGVDVLLLVPAVALTMLLATGLGLVVSALHVYFRDVKYLVTAATTVWFYGTPIFYPLEELDGGLRSLVVANPATGMVQLHRAALGADVTSLAPSVLITVVASLALVVLGIALHARWDRVFADLL